MSKKTTRRQKAKLTGKVDFILVGLAALALGYLGLMTWLHTSSPFMLVHGGSMEPTIHAGDLLLNRTMPATSIKVGDIIAFDTPKEEREQKELPATLAHRVMSIEGRAGELVFVTKGDNSDTDRMPVPASAVRGVMVKNLGVLGRPFILFTNTRILVMVGLPVVAFLVVGGLVSMMGTPGGQSARAAGARQHTSPTDDRAFGQLAEAVTEYGTHLKSHTRVMVNLAATTEELNAAVREQKQASSAMAQLRTVVRRQKRASDELRQAVIEQNHALEGLDAVVYRVSGAMTEPEQEADDGDRKGGRRRHDGQHGAKAA